MIHLRSRGGPGILVAALGAFAVLAVFGEPTVLAGPRFAGERPFAVLVPELREIYPDSKPEEIGTASLQLHTPRGVPLGVHLLLEGGDPAAEITFRVTEGEGSVEGASWYRLIDVPVEENTGLVSRTERWDGERNPHVIRRAPFRVFEVLKPVHSPILTDASTVALRLEIPIASDAPPGEGCFEVEIERGEERVTLSLGVVVHRAVVPPVGADTFRYTNWFSTARIASRHGAEEWSEEFWEMLARYAALMARGRQNVFWVRWSDFFARGEGGERHLDRERLVRYVQVFTDAGLHWIEGAPFAGRPGGDWSTTTLHINLTGLSATTEEGSAALIALLAELRECIIEEGWEERWIQHLADEPTDSNALDYRKLAEIFREQMPGIPILEATMSRKLVGAVDIWCPQVQEFQRHRDFFEERRAAGDHLWVYTCLVPGGPWINRLLDMERLRPVWIGWAAAIWELEGFLHWGLNHYRADPFERSVVDHGAEPNTKNRLPAGDSHIVYPGPDGPWSSQRFEAHRIGMEDHELLRRLLAEDSELAQRIVAGGFRAFDDFSTDLDQYLDARRELLEALDR
jgi:hypothetical protein